MEERKKGRKREREEKERVKSEMSEACKAEKQLEESSIFFLV